jgi:hypothetical protein
MGMMLLAARSRLAVLAALLLVAAAPSCRGQGLAAAASGSMGASQAQAKLKNAYRTSINFKAAFNSSPSRACATGALW